MKFIFTVEDESFGDQKLIMQIPIDGSAAKETAVQIFEDVLCVLANEIAVKENRDLVVSDRIDGRPSQYQLEQYESIKSALEA